MSNADTSAPPVDQRGARGSGFWTVAFAFLIVMAFATLPSPLYGLYRTRDDLSALTITIVCLNVKPVSTIVHGTAPHSEPVEAS